MANPSNLLEINPLVVVSNLLGFPKKKRRVFAQTLPRRLGDCVCLNPSGPCERCTIDSHWTAENIFSLKLSDITARHLERCKLHFPVEIEPENFFLVFSQSFKGLIDAPVYEYGVDEPGNKIAGAFGCYHAQAHSADQKSNAKPWAVVFCKVLDCQKLEQFGFAPQKDATRDSDYYKLSFAEFEKVAASFEDVDHHCPIDCSSLQMLPGCSQVEKPLTGTGGKP